MAARVSVRLRDSVPPWSNLVHARKDLAPRRAWPQDFRLKAEATLATRLPSPRTLPVDYAATYVFSQGDHSCVWFARLPLRWSWPFSFLPFMPDRRRRRP